MNDRGGAGSWVGSRPTADRRWTCVCLLSAEKGNDYGRNMFCTVRTQIAD